MGGSLQVFAAKEAAARLRCSTAHVYRLIRTGRLQGVRRRADAAWRVPAIALARFLGTPVPRAERSDDELLDLEEVVALSRLSERTVRADLAAGRLEGRLIARRWRVRVAAYRRWIGLR